VQFAQKCFERLLDFSQQFHLIHVSKSETPLSACSDSNSLLQAQGHIELEKDRRLRGNDICSSSVCFDLGSTNVVQLSMSSKVAKDHR
jgi:hypothetical protein